MTTDPPTVVLDADARHPGAAILAVPMDDNDADAATIRDYLTALLRRVWRQGEDFSGKRPFGNSGWHWDLYKPLVSAGLISGTFDEDGYLDDCAGEDGDALIRLAIDALGIAPQAGEA